MTLVITDATIYPDPDGPAIEDRIVLARGGRIDLVASFDETSLPAGATRIDGRGRFLLAGFQNSHVHFSEPKWQGAAELPAERLSAQLGEMFLSYGFTTVVDTGSSLPDTLALRARIEAGDVRGPRILTAGTPLYPEKGIPYYLKDTLPPEVFASLRTPKTEDEAVEIVARQVEAGTDVVKLFAGSWVEPGRVLPMSVDVARAAAEEAHRRNEIVFAHASSIAGLEVALEAQVDVLAHALDDDRGWGPSFVDRMTRQGMAMIPTLKLFGGQPYTKYIQQEVQDYARRRSDSVRNRRWLSHRLHPTQEYELLSGAGLDWRRILASLTTAPAERFGEADRRGRIAPGMDADLVLLNADPSLSVVAFADVVCTVRRGAVVYQARR